MSVFSTLEQFSMVRSYHKVTLIQNAGILQLIHQQTELGNHIGNIFIIPRTIVVKQRLPDVIGKFMSLLGN